MEKFFLFLILIVPFTVILLHQINQRYVKDIDLKVYFVLPIMIYLLGLFLLLTNSSNLGSYELNYIDIHSINIPLTFLFNSSNILMSIVVLLVSLCVLVYSSKFISGENLYRHFRYSLFLTVFISSMVFFSLSNDLLSSFIFWEFLGLCSFFLIAFYNHDKKAIYSSIMAFWLTRLGDLFFLMGLIIIYFGSSSMGFDEINKFLSTTPNSFNNMAFIFILIGILTKCAQYPFTVWLPRAMKGPTPISALIHSATMVVAGILLLYKMSPSISFFPFVQDSILYIGLITSLLCAIYALYEDDLKAVLAYSTLSHIGFMMIPLGQNSQNLGFFHLYSHSFFKSLLFLIAGYLIIKYNENSIKKLKNKLTLFSPVGIIFTIGCLSLAGIFPLTGSFSKEHIIINFLNVEGYIPSVILIISIIFTCLYSSKLLFNVIKIEKNNFSNFFNSFNNELLYLVPITFLGILSLLGFFSQNFYLNFLKISFEEITIIQLLSIQLPIIFIFILNYFYEEKIKIITNDIIQISKYFIEIENIYRTLYRNIFVQFGKFIGWFDRNIIDGIINLPPYFIVNLSSYFQKVQNGFIRGYASKFIIIIIFVIIILGISYNI